MGTAKNTKNQVNALDLLTSQHEVVDKLITRLKEGKLAKGAKEAAFRELADNLAAHATIEEKLFYPTVKTKKLEDMLLESTEEHLAIKRVLADLLELDVEDERFDAKIKVLGEEVDHHAHDEEEDEMFPKVRKGMDAEELEALGAEMLAMFEQLMTQDPRMNVPKETRKAAEV